MAANTASLEIDKYTYVVSEFGSKVGRKVLFRLIRAIGPAAKGFALKGFTEEGFAASIAAFAESASEGDFEFICDALAEVTIVREKLSNGQSIDLSLAKQFDDHFRGHYGWMLLWLKFAITHNFTSFLSEIGSGMPPEVRELFYTLLKKTSGSESPPA